MLPGAREDLDGRAAVGHCCLQRVLQRCLPGWRLAGPDGRGAQVNLQRIVKQKQTAELLSYALKTMYDLQGSQ
jgi:hypothetical protein